MAKKILVVEDDAVNRKLFVTLLREKGYEVRGAADGREALDAIRKESPGLVLMDIILPGMSGLEVIKTCRVEGLLDNTKVYALTAAAEGGIDDSGFDGIIMKPVKIAEFIKTVEKALESDNL